MKLIYPVFLSSNFVADNIMQTHQWQVLAENQKVRVPAYKTRREPLRYGFATRLTKN